MRAGARAFTLLEILIAVAILAFGMAGVLAVFAAAAGSHRRAVDEMEAAMVASGLAAEARARFRGRGELVPRIGIKVPGKPRYRCDVDYFPLDEEGDEVLMEIDVRWKERGRGAALVFHTILLRQTD